MFIESLIKIFKKNLNKLKVEIELYDNESHLWLTEGEVTNATGNLTLHIVGNLNHYIGATLGNTGYIRKRDLEFALKSVSRIELLKQIDDTKAVVENTLRQLSEETIQKEYPLLVFKESMTTGFFLIHLTTHLAYHLGQINYHRRLLD
ncbi:DinB family protein [uncultured Algibacter sp.]|uniref:DinB family protein n=1 Tax=uncultured Algibacter sp. TaxID=298659 RepID=UPI0030ED82FD|tara:strand:+ start:216 stop:659 length:444 start_codon:yes stop_codon:yes gene_type:complete